MIVTKYKLPICHAKTTFYHFNIKKGYFLTSQNRDWFYFENRITFASTAIGIWTHTLMFLTGTCAFCHTLKFINYYAGIFFLTAMSVDRYVAVAYSTKSHQVSVYLVVIKAICNISQTNLANFKSFTGKMPKILTPNQY